jgi:alpha-D-xyloside xylohydrolase
MHSAGETLRLSVCGPTLIHIVAGPGDARASSPAEPWMAHAVQARSVSISPATRSRRPLSTAGLRVRLSLEDGRLTFQDAAGNTLETESDREPRRYEPHSGERREVSTA